MYRTLVNAAVIIADHQRRRAAYASGAAEDLERYNNVLRISLDNGIESKVTLIF